MLCALTGKYNLLSVPYVFYCVYLVQYNLNNIEISQPTTSTNYGVYGEATGPGENIGVFGTASGGVTSTAVYASGDLVYTGALINVSDMRLKKEIKKIDSALDFIQSLRPKVYKFKSDEFEKLNLSDASQFSETDTRPMTL